jgi:exodeoxyribonuclease VII small subunit
MKDKELNFEKALADLEKIVEKLEQSGLSLNESLGLFEKGVHLSRFLRAELEKAEKKVEILLKDEKGEVRREPFSLEEAAGEGAAKEEEEAEESGGEPEKKAASRGAKKKAGGDESDKLPF